MNKKHLLITIVLFLLFSCTTVKPFYGTADLHGFVYDFNDNPVSNCSVYIDGIHKATTDTYGRFTVKSLKSGSYFLETKSLEYESYYGNFMFLEQAQIVFIKVLSIEALYLDIENALINKNFVEADELIYRALMVNKKDKNTLMYLAVLRFYEDNKKGALQALNASKIYKEFDESMLKFEKILRGESYE